MSRYSFPCPGCASVLTLGSVPPADKRIKCPGCGGVFAPNPQSPAEGEDATTADPTLAGAAPIAAPARSKQTRTAHQPLFFTAVGMAGLLTVQAMTIGFWYVLDATSNRIEARKSKDDPKNPVGRPGFDGQFPNEAARWDIFVSASTKYSILMPGVTEETKTPHSMVAVSRANDIIVRVDVWDQLEHQRDQSDKTILGDYDKGGRSVEKQLLLNGHPGMELSGPIDLVRVFVVDRQLIEISTVFPSRAADRSKAQIAFLSFRLSDRNPTDLRGSGDLQKVSHQPVTLCLANGA